MTLATAAVVLLGAPLWAGPQQTADAETQLEAAIHTEMVTGNLKGAIEQYKAILVQAPHSRAVAAGALFHLAQCQEKLGQRKEAHATYKRVITEYADQGQPARDARAKLASWSDAPPGPRNLGFDEGESGKLPPGWFVPFVQHGSERMAELRRRGCRSGASCAVVAGPPDAPKPLGKLMQSFSAAAYRGKTVRLRASLRVEGTDAEGRAQMWLHVDRIDGRNGFFDNMDDRPVRSTAWTNCEIVSQIDDDAQFIDFGVSAIGKGRVWVDDVSFQIVPKAEISSAREAIENLYTGIVSDGARYREYGTNQPLSTFLEQWNTQGFRVTQTELISFRLSGPGAVTTVRSTFSLSAADEKLAGINTFRDTWGRMGDGWQLKERVFLTRRFSVPSTDPDTDTAKLIAADLKQFAAPLATAQAGHKFYDLAPFGSAIGDARIVALGEAADGTRECFQMKHRLLEYLVRERGFTTLAVMGNASAVDAVNRYITTGEGDPKAALAGMDSWRWSTQEALDLVEWMRSYNRSSTGHSTLSLVAFDQSPMPSGKIVVWAHNEESSLSKLRARFEDRIYSVGFRLHRGELRAVGFKNGDAAGLARHNVSLPGGTGDWVFGAAGMPLFFLDFHAVPPLTTLALWLAEPHLFLSARTDWNRDDPESHLRPETLWKIYDGLIFMEEAHAATGLEETNASNF